jgi:hypothetical protein
MAREDPGKGVFLPDDAQGSAFASAELRSHSALRLSSSLPAGAEWTEKCLTPF